MSTMPSPPRHRQSAPGARRRAWLWFASAPVFFVVAFAAGEGLSALLGLVEGDVSRFTWRELLVLVVALSVVAVPAVGARVVARRAHGDVLTRLPGWILVALVLFFLVANLVGFLVPPAPD
ncbi:hypothetical protein [Isoptericola sediminis]|uniref:Uncharacterized protein n=1 Tax=Isoptericola sediminis TaxID=2733572 RepID=A0A849KB60_9MICO|nr:hypothetical protein [Isoptericola sediminis]NNU28467.1 hypothetical protein [Isoptericola sediminis]